MAPDVARALSPLGESGETFDTGGSSTLHWKGACSRDHVKVRMIPAHPVIGPRPNGTFLTWGTSRIVSLDLGRRREKPQ